MLGQSQETESWNETRLAEVTKRNKETLIVSAWESKECHWRVQVHYLIGKGKITDYKEGNTFNCSLGFFSKY